MPKAGAKPPAASAKAPPASDDAAERSKTIERIFECLAAGLPQDWWRAWAEFAQREEIAWNERSIEGRFFYLTNTDRSKPQDLKSCDAREVAELTLSLNQFLDPDKRRWKAARLEFGRDGSFELKYDYSQ
ncbi:MAG: hypothetical protein ACT4P9_06835 [Betaproteobacteria bacterium]